MRLQGKAAIITGASSGIGEAMARLFAREGANVLAVARSEEPLQRMHAEDQRIHALVQDVALDAAADTIVGQCVRLFGGLDIVVNNAAYEAVAMTERMTDDMWDQTMAVNLRAAFRLCRSAIPELKKRPHGRIINIASLMTERADYGFAAYAASKAGLAGLTRTLAVELGKYGATANYILPGAVLTPMSARALDTPAIRDALFAKTPLRRFGEPIEIANGALFLASDESSFVTGAGLVMDGGMSLRT
jgi:NAD(P)-dependent dehydrogenase (short-subunit alcohol dehydrogenase family)